MGSKLRVSGIIPESIVDGEGLRLVVFTQGCSHHCKGCHNPETHPLMGGREMHTEEIIAMARGNPLLSGITFSGGEPFLQPAPLCEIASALRTKEFDIVTYTGYTYEALLVMADTNEDIQRLLDITDILIDGLFIEEEKDLSLPFRGSRNQRILRLRES